jgi:UDP-N-acetylglucosamine 2-epimerase (non-hydrolysing)
VLVAYGTRPEAVKVAPLVLALRESPLFTPVVAVTGQHRSMLDQVNEVFGITPDVDLDIHAAGQTLGDVTTRSLGGFEGVLAEHRPDAVVVQGDTTTTFSVALAGFYARVPVVHMEAGLRTNDVSSPFPEEINRRLTTQLAALHLAPTPQSRANLLAEGVDPARVHVTGNTVIDALQWTAGRGLPYGDPALDDLDASDRRVLLVTAHRRESWGVPMQAVGRALARLARRYPDLLVVLPVHRNPVVRKALLPFVAALPNVRVTEPLAYGGFCRLLARADLVLTDSGGVQEEAPSLGKPVLVLRDTTERPEAVAAGTARLVGTDEELVVATVSTLLDDPDAYARMAQAVNPYGDGRAAERTVAALAHFFGIGARPEEFGADLERVVDLRVPERVAL